MFIDPDMKLRTSSFNMSIGEIMDKVAHDEINLLPKYKLGLMWDVKLQSRYVESVLLGLPLNGFLFEESETGMFSVVDGTQRLNSIIEYINGYYSLSNLTVLINKNSHKYDELEYSEQLILRRALCSIIVLDRNSHPILKCEYLKRINIGHPTFEPQQARNFAFPNAHNIVQDGWRYLSKYFNFRLSNQNSGKRQFKLILKEEQFFLSLVLIEFISTNRSILSSDMTLGAVFDIITQEFEQSIIPIEQDHLKYKIKSIFDEFNINNLNLVNRSYALKSKYRENELSMNDFLLMYLQHSFSTSSKRKPSSFNFFKEDTPIRRLERFL